MINESKFVEAHRALINSRRFVPSSMYPADFDLTPEARTSHGVFGYQAIPFPYEEWICPGCKQISNYTSAQLIAIDGGCRDNGKASARSAIGVYFAAASTLNWSELLEGPIHTNQKAELAACRLALRALFYYSTERWSFLGVPLPIVIIKADSEYVVKGMTDWVFKWKQNGYRNAKGKPVTNAALFQEIDEMVQQLNEVGIVVLFWHVPREQNIEADALVNAAFDTA